MSDLARGLFPSRFMYAKTDSSLRDGFELVTQPFSWLWLKNNTAVWKQLFDLFDENYYGTLVTAGMHLHLSKAAFNTWHLYKFVNFFYKKQTRTLLAGISQRPKLEQSKHCKFDILDVSNNKYMARKKQNASRDPHHSAVNLKPQHTIEVRIFQMPGTFVDFLKNMEFTYSVYNFSKEVPPTDLYTGRYLEWLCERPRSNQYRNLLQFIKTSPNFPTQFKTIIGG